MAHMSANVTSQMAQTSLHASADKRSKGEEEFRYQFGAVLAQLKVDNIASLASSVRQNMRPRDNVEQTDPRKFTEPLTIECQVNSVPLFGSFNLAYRVLFDDGVEWILKVPANGSRGRFDQLAADSMTSEAFTMKMIKRLTSIPVPTVHSFDVSSKNEIGCPYILMDFLQGRPLYEGWFNRGFSKAKREQFRARALQTTAAAMVQLNVFTLHRGGALRFDSAGQPEGVTGAKVLDIKDCEGCGVEGSQPEHDTWCENVSTSDPSSYFLFMLNRRGYKKGDSVYSRGVHDSTRLFTKWAFEIFDKVHRSEGQFVLAHPDFDLQNILVQEDGTLSGILDWDGVAAVPLSVGCLRYPSWIMPDCGSVKRTPDCDSVDLWSTPGDLFRYRVMYEQFIEALLPCGPANSKTGKLGADITRLSLVTGLLQTAIDWPEDTASMIGELYREIERQIGRDDNNNVSDAKTQGSNVEPGSGVSNDSDAVARLVRTKVQDTSSDEETGRTEIEKASPGLLRESRRTDPERLGQQCVTNMHQPPLENFDDRPDSTNFSAIDATSREEHRLEKDGLALPSCVDNLAEDAAHDQKPPTTRKDGVPKRALGLGEKGSEGMAKVLHQKETSEGKPSRKVRVIKWVLSLGEKGCREASKAFHKQKKASGQQVKDRAELASAPNDSSAYSKTGQIAECLGKHAETLLRKIAARMHRYSEKSTPVETTTNKAQRFLESLIALLKTIIWRLLSNSAEKAETPAAAKGRTSQKTVLVGTAQCQRCNLGEVTPEQEIADHSDEFAKMKSEDVWACIAAEVEKSGIQTDMIKERQDMIAQFVIENLRREIEREMEDELRLKGKKEDRNTKEMRKQTKLTNTKPPSNATFIQHPALTIPKLIGTTSTEARVTEIEAAEAKSPEEGAPNAANAKAETTPRDVAGSHAGMEETNSEMVGKRRSCKPESQINACTKSRIGGPGHLGFDAVSPHHVQSYNSESGSLESESLISKLQAAKQRYDKMMALKKQKSGSANLRPVNDGTETAHLGDVEEKASTPSLAPGAVEEANQKLRMILESLATSHVSSTSFGSTLSQAAGNDGTTMMQVGIKNSRASKNDATESNAIDLANQKLKTVLSNLQEPVAVDAELQPYIYHAATNENKDSEVVAAHCQTVVKGGHWFETPRGGLKRIEVEQTVNDSVQGREAVVESSCCFPDKSRASPEMSMAENEDQDEELAEVSKLQLSFPNPYQSETVNVFQVPDIDEDATDGGEECNVEVFTQKGNGEEGEGLEEGGLREEGISMQGGVRGNAAKRVSAGREVSKTPGRMEIVDNGNFNMEEVCVALGGGNLDQNRMSKLETGFQMMVAEILGWM